jgi:hypothetical protein
MTIHEGHREVERRLADLESLSERPSYDHRVDQITGWRRERQIIRMRTGNAQCDKAPVASGRHTGWMETLHFWLRGIRRPG